MIGVFDSGLGGLTVVREIFKQSPDAQVVYFGDTARTPYGTKSEETIIKYALEDADFLVKQGAKVLVVACNTVSSCAIETLKEKFNIPIFGVITPATKRAIEITKGRVGIIGTRATINSGVYEEKIKKQNKDLKIFSQSCPLFVPIVEENWINKPETKMIVRRYLSPLKVAQIDTLILGCTHYPFLKNIIQEKIGKHIKIVDSAEEVVKRLENIKFESGESRFFVSDLTPHFQNLASCWLGKPIKIEKI